MPSLAQALIRWHAAHGRHDLPWQRERTPYRVWVSEIMLQQTQVATVIPFYARFLQRFPDIRALAAAPLDEVLHRWSGLGYYSRARHLKQAAERVVREHGGELPDDLGGLMALPGVGRSTAAAILALAHGRRAAILDGNVRRVLSRYFGIAGTPGAAATQRALWRRAEQCTPQTRLAEYTQAIMDFGATFCTRRAPSCTECPLRGRCVARQTGRVQTLPGVRPRRARPLRRRLMLLAYRADGCVLLRRRPVRGVWGGLWVPLEFADREAVRRFCREGLRRARLEPNALPGLRHGFTHFELEITPLRARCAGLRRAMEESGMLWYNARDPARIGLPAPIVTLLSQVSNS